MSINRDMRLYVLQKKENVRTDTGAEKVSWIDAGTITAAIRKKDELRMVANERYRDATPVSYTHLDVYKRQPHRGPDRVTRKGCADV